MSEPLQPNSNILLELVQIKMPFGKYKDTVLCNLPVSYLEWFYREGFPPGKLGMQLATIYEIKINGLEHLLQPLKKKYGTGSKIR
ncbi:DUF3820 family protein [Pontibacter sp. MBLB2868]|uniref:DUF3820 family protein n=1 Tax=Pontibacter sp. MBLB2868 TaxID=3451555 RepID=UPI003F751496